MSSRVASKSSAIPASHTHAPALLIPALLLVVSGAAALAQAAPLFQGNDNAGTHRPSMCAAAKPPQKSG